MLVEGNTYSGYSSPPRTLEELRLVCQRVRDQIANYLPLNYFDWKMMRQLTASSTSAAGTSPFS